MKSFSKLFQKHEKFSLTEPERPTQRPKDKKKQKETYSGKKRHTRKNLVITEKNKRVGFLGKTVSGKTHDFTMLKKQVNPDNMPSQIKKHLDLGFKGFQKQFPGHKTFMPTRKPRSKELTGFRKKQNKKKSGIRVLVV